MSMCQNVMILLMKQFNLYFNVLNILIKLNHFN
jgi:hypothetical protein